MTEKEALKLALEALKYPLNQSHENFNVDMAELLAHRAITAIKEALAQPEQEPVACVEYIPCCTDQTCPKCKAATPPQRTWVGLTDSEIGTIAYNVNPLDGIRQFSRAVEAKLKEKNT